MKWIIYLLMVIVMVEVISALTSLQDESPYGRNLTAYNSPTYVNTGLQYYNFTKATTSGYLSTSPSSGNITYNRRYNYTWGARVQLKSYDSNSSLMHYVIYNTALYFGVLYLKPQVNRVVCVTKNSTGIEVNDIYTMNSNWSGQWHRVVCRYTTTSATGATIETCVDSVCTGSPGVMAGATGTVANQINYISRSAVTEAFNGSIDDVMLWENISFSNANLTVDNTSTTLYSEKLLFKYSFTNSTSDPCVYSGAGNWVISTHCNMISTTYNVAGIVNITGTGWLNITGTSVLNATKIIWVPKDAEEAFRMRWITPSKVRWGG